MITALFFLFLFLIFSDFPTIRIICGIFFLYCGFDSGHWVMMLIIIISPILFFSGVNAFFNTDSK